MSQAQKTMSAPKKSTGQRIGSTISWLIVIFLVIWSCTGMSFDMQKALNSMPIVKNIFKGLFHPEWTFMNEDEGVLDNMLITLETALLGTSTAAILAVPFGFLAARNMSKKMPWLSWIGKRILNIIRTLPELIVAIIFLVAVGPGPFAGMLALGFHSIGMIGKMYSEAIENMDEGPMEALTAVGASRLQTLWHSVLPQVLPQFASFALYKFEIDVRAASVLGMVGAGGIGTPLLFALQSQAWDRVGIIFIGIIVAVIIIDFISGAIRKRLV